MSHAVPTSFSTRPELARGPRPLRPATLLPVLAAAGHGLGIVAAAKTVAAGVESADGVAPRVGVPSAAVAATVASTGPAALPGYWFSIANGDTTRDLLREGDVLWAATDGGGVVRWVVSKRSWTQYLAPQNGLASNDVRALARDRAGVLWAATAAGLARLDEDTGRWRTVRAGAEAFASQSVTALSVAPDGAIWVGFEQRWDADAPHPALDERGAFVGGGLARFEPDTGSWGPLLGEGPAPEAGSRSPGLPSQNVTSVAVDRSGLLWVGTRPAFAWRPDACGQPVCPPELGAWGQVGGGLAATDDPARGFRHWSPATDGSCLASASHVSALAADDAARVWVATRGRGLQAYLSGLEVEICRPETGHRHYARNAGGLPGNHVWSLAVDGGGRVWSGVGDGERGLGVAVLDHRGTVEDPDQPGSDDRWVTIGLDDRSGPLDAVVSAVDVSGPEAALGTRDERSGDGWGLKLLGDPDEPAARGPWGTLATAETGLPSNQVTALAVDPTSGDVWFGTRRRGIAVWDGAGFEHLEAFGRGPRIGDVAVDTPRGSTVLTFTVGADELIGSLGPPPHLVRLGEDRAIVELLDPGPASGGGSRASIRPSLSGGLPAGTRVYATTRALAGDGVTAIAFDPAGRPWVAAHKTLLRPARPDSGDRYCETFPDCWYDGGLASPSDGAWVIHTPAAADGGPPVRDVLSLSFDAEGRLWAGTGDVTADDGDGVLLRGADGAWQNVRRDTVGPDFGGDVVTAIDLDPITGHMWLATHHGRCDPGSISGDCPANGRAGGGVSRFDGSGWQRWTKNEGSALSASGPDGNFTALRFDAGRGGVWAGAWSEGSSSAHWLLGEGIDATVNACPRNCRPDAWSSTRFPDDGTVRALAIDADGRLWAGASRDNRGAIPHPGGVQVFDGASWSRVPTDVWSNEVTALARQASGMWVGTFDGGAARWWPVELRPGAYLPVARR